LAVLLLTWPHGIQSNNPPPFEPGAFHNNMVLAQHMYWKCNHHDDLLAQHAVGYNCLVDGWLEGQVLFTARVFWASCSSLAAG
jgi:hypothetical protein